MAGIKKYVKTNQVKNETLVGILSGANMNFDRLRFVADRAEVGEHREVLFSVTIPEEEDLSEDSSLFSATATSPNSITVFPMPRTPRFSSAFKLSIEAKPRKSPNSSKTMDSRA